MTTFIIAARNADKAEAVIGEIGTSTGNPCCDYIVADLASLRQVRQLAETFRHRYARLDVLINNAGVFLPGRTETEDGYETTFQVNYLSPFVLLASSPEVSGVSGQYFTRSKPTPVKNRFDTPENRALLWDLSMKAAERGATMAAGRAT